MKQNGIIRIKQIVQCDLDPVPRICPKDQRDRLSAAAQHISSLFQGDKEQPLRIVVAEAVVDEIFPDRGNFEFPNHGVRRR